MNKFLLNRLSLVALVGLTALPVLAQDDMSDDDMSNRTMQNGTMRNGTMQNDDMMDDNMMRNPMNSIPNMTRRQRTTMQQDVTGMSNAQRNRMMGRMTGSRTMRDEEMRRIAWYKRNYGTNWRNHYSPGI